METIKKFKAAFASKKAKIALALSGVGATLATAPAAYAEPAIANDTLEGLPDVGEDMGGFLTNLAPGVGVFILIIGLFVGIAAIVAAIGVGIVTVFKRMKFGGR